MNFKSGQSDHVQQLRLLALCDFEPAEGELDSSPDRGDCSTLSLSLQNCASKVLRNVLMDSKRQNEPNRGSSLHGQFGSMTNMDFLRDAAYRCSKYFGRNVHRAQSGKIFCASLRDRLLTVLKAVQHHVEQVHGYFIHRWVMLDLKGDILPYPSKDEELRKSLQPAMEGEESSSYRIFLESMRSVFDQPTSASSVGSSGPPPLQHSSFLSLKQINSGDMPSILTASLLTDKSKGGGLRSSPEIEGFLAAHGDEGASLKGGFQDLCGKVEALLKNAVGKGNADGASQQQNPAPPSRGILPHSGVHASNDAARAVGKLSSASILRAKPSQIPLVAKGKENSSLVGANHGSEHLGRGGSRIAMFKRDHVPQPGGNTATRREVDFGNGGSKVNESKQKAHEHNKHLAAPSTGKPSTRLTTAPSLQKNVPVRSVGGELRAGEVTKGAWTGPASISALTSHKQAAAADEPDPLLCALDAIQEAERAASVFLEKQCTSWNGASREAGSAVTRAATTDINTCTRGAPLPPGALTATTPTAAAARIQHATRASTQLLVQQLQRCSEPSVEEALQRVVTKRMEVAEKARRSRQDQVYDTAYDIYTISSGAVDGSILPDDEEGCGDNGIALPCTPAEASLVATKPKIWKLLASWCTGSDVAHLGLGVRIRHPHRADFRASKPQSVMLYSAHFHQMLRQVQKLVNMLDGGDQMDETSKCAVSQGAHINGELFFHSCIKPNLGEMLPSIIARIEVDFGDGQKMACPCGCTGTPSKAHQREVPKPQCVGVVCIEEVDSRQQGFGVSSSRLAPRVNYKHPEHL
eukprot:gene32039-16569_t